MPMITTPDGTGVHYKDWGSGPPVVFSHGWPLNADVWDEQLLLVASRGFRAIAHDRRGHGRSDQPWGGHDMDTYADDLACLLRRLDLRGAVLVGHSTGGGEVVRYLARHGSGRVAKAVLVGAVPPLLTRESGNPDGVPAETFDAIRRRLRADRAQFYWELAGTFYGTAVSDGLRRAFWSMSMRCALKAAFDCVAAFAETDFTADLRGLDVPALVAHGDADRIVPLAASAMHSARLIPEATLKVYSGAGHGLAGDYRDEFHADLLAYLATAPVTETVA